MPFQHTPLQEGLSYPGSGTLWARSHQLHVALHQRGEAQNREEPFPSLSLTVGPSTLLCPRTDTDGV